MKTVCRTMGLARSHVRELSRRDDSWTDGRRRRTPKGDAQLLAELRQEIAQLPSYGYRRACALVNRQRSATGDVRVNAKRVYRVMAQAGLLLPKAPRRRHSSRYCSKDHELNRPGFPRRLGASGSDAAQTRQAAGRQHWN